MLSSCPIPECKTCTLSASLVVQNSAGAASVGRSAGVFNSTQPTSHSDRSISYCPRDRLCLAVGEPPRAGPPLPLMLRRRVAAAQRRRWAKNKLAVLLRGAGRAIMVGRILMRLKRRGVLVEPRRNPISPRKPAASRRYAVRKPKDYITASAGRPGRGRYAGRAAVARPGVRALHPPRRDLALVVIEVHNRATTTTAAAFLDTVAVRMPLALRAIQV
jgi:hypothetical protein